MRHYLLLALVLVTGCEAVVHFDRSKIDGGNATDGGTNAAARVSALVGDDAGVRSTPAHASALREEAASEAEDSR